MNRSGNCEEATHPLLAIGGERKSERIRLTTTRTGRLREFDLGFGEL
jgi:hypothetical protein